MNRMSSRNYGNDVRKQVLMIALARKSDAELKTMSKMSNKIYAEVAQSILDSRALSGSVTGGRAKRTQRAKKSKRATRIRRTHH